MSLVAEQFQFIKDVAKLIQFCEQQGLVITAGELYRPPEMQKIYVQTGRSKTMNSKHGQRCAIDLNFFKDGKLIYDVAVLRPVGEYWQSLSPKNSAGMFWKSFKDVPHFERRV
jgi:D-alanyl-D-alanine dipeptidase